MFLLTAEVCVVLDWVVIVDFLVKLGVDKERVLVCEASLEVVKPLQAVFLSLSRRDDVVVGPLHPAQLAHICDFLAN